MRAITYNGAYQYGEEADKGTLEAGKLADLVVLDRNPLAVDPREIRDIWRARHHQGGRHPLRARREVGDGSVAWKKEGRPAGFPSFFAFSALFALCPGLRTLVELCSPSAARVLPELRFPDLSSPIRAPGSRRKIRRR